MKLGDITAEVRAKAEEEASSGARKRTGCESGSKSKKESGNGVQERE